MYGITFMERAHPDNTIELPAEIVAASPYLSQQPDARIEVSTDLFTLFRDYTENRTESAQAYLSANFQRFKENAEVLLNEAIQLGYEPITRIIALGDAYKDRVFRRVEGWTRTYAPDAVQSEVVSIPWATRAEFFDAYQEYATTHMRLSPKDLKTLIKVNVVAIDPLGQTGTPVEMTYEQVEYSALWVRGIAADRRIYVSSPEGQLDGTTASIGNVVDFLRKVPNFRSQGKISGSWTQVRGFSFILSQLYIPTDVQRLLIESPGFIESISDVGTISRFFRNLNLVTPLDQRPVASTFLDDMKQRQLDVAHNQAYLRLIDRYMRLAEQVEGGLNGEDRWVIELLKSFEPDVREALITNYEGTFSKKLYLEQPNVRLISSNNEYILMDDQVASKSRYLRERMRTAEQSSGQEGRQEYLFREADFTTSDLQLATGLMTAQACAREGTSYSDLRKFVMTEQGEGMSDWLLRTGYNVFVDYVMPLAGAYATYRTATTNANPLAAAGVGTATASYTGLRRFWKKYFADPVAPKNAEAALKSHDAWGYELAFVRQALIPEYVDRFAQRQRGGKTLAELNEIGLSRLQRYFNEVGFSEGILVDIGRYYFFNNFDAVRQYFIAKRAEEGGTEIADKGIKPLEFGINYSMSVGERLDWVWMRPLAAHQGGRVLDLSWQMIGSLRGIEGVEGITNVVKLTLEENALVSLEGLGELQGISEILCSRNSLASVNPEDLPASLTRLDLMGNRLTYIDIEGILARCPQLKSIDLNGNNLPSFEVERIVKVWEAVRKASPERGMIELKANALDGAQNRGRFESILFALRNLMTRITEGAKTLWKRTKTQDVVSRTAIATEQEALANPSEADALLAQGQAVYDAMTAGDIDGIEREIDTLAGAAKLTEEERRDLAEQLDAATLDTAAIAELPIIEPVPEGDGGSEAATSEASFESAYQVPAMEGIWNDYDVSMRELNRTQEIERVALREAKEQELRDVTEEARQQEIEQRYEGQMREVNERQARERAELSQERERRLEEQRRQERERVEASREPRASAGV